MFKCKYWILLFASHSLYALSTCHVTADTDSNPEGIGAPGELRYCLNLMNQGLNATADDYEIVFDSQMTIHLNGILPIINNSSNTVNIIIGNPDPASTVTIDGNNIYRGFFIPMGTVTIQNLNFRNLIAKGGNGGDGISGGGGGMGAGGAIYAPRAFLNGFSPSITLKNVSINNSSAVGGNGGNHIDFSPLGNEGGGGGGGGFSGDGGSITIGGRTGGAGGGGFGGNGGNATQGVDDQGGGGGGGGGLGSRASSSIQGYGGDDQYNGESGSGYGLLTPAGAGASGNSGGSNAGGGGGGGIGPSYGGGGGGSSGGTDGFQATGSIPLRLQFLWAAAPSGGSGQDGGGGGGGAVVMISASNGIDGQAGNGGYAAGGGGGAGAGAHDNAYSVQGGLGGVGGGGGGGGVNQSGMTPAAGGNSIGGGGGGGGGPTAGSNALGGIDAGNLGGGAGGMGSASVGSNAAGGGGGGGSGLGGAIFVDTNLNFTIQALSGTATTFNTPNTTTQAGTHGTGGPGAEDGTDGISLGNSIFLRSGSTLIFLAQDINDVLTLGSQVAFTDDTTLGAGSTSVRVNGNGTVVYNGTSDYEGLLRVNNANFKVNGLLDQTSIEVCRDNNFSAQRGTLSGVGTLTGPVSVNSGVISPEPGGTLTLGRLTLNNPSSGTLGSLVHINIDSNGTSLVAATGTADLAGILEINLAPNAQPGQYILLTSSGITGTFNSVTFSGGTTPNYRLSYLPVGAPTYVQFDFLGNSVEIPATVNGSPILNPAIVCCGRPVILGPLPVPGPGPTTYTITNVTGNVSCQIRHTQYQTYLKMNGSKGSCTVIGTKNGVVSNPLKVIAP